MSRIGTCESVSVNKPFGDAAIHVRIVNIHPPIESEKHEFVSQVDRREEQPRRTVGNATPPFRLDQKRIAHGGNPNGW